MEKDIKERIVSAQKGDKKALEYVIKSVKDYIYNLSLKMLLFPEDAKDATQEILIKIITHLSTFKHQSQFKTWVYKIAVNNLMNFKGKKAKNFTMPFEDYAKLIDTGQSPNVKYTTNKGELLLLEEEVKVSCTQGLLLCLNKEDRMVYILTEILDFNSKEGAQILELTPENYRKKLSRSRQKIRHFLNKKCGLVNPKNPCRCSNKIDFLIEENIINPTQKRFAIFKNRSIDLFDQIGELEKSIALYRSVEKFSAPEVVFEKLKSIITIDQ